MRQSEGDAPAVQAAPVGSTAAGPDDGGDGRTLRRTRNRQAVIVALLDLIREGELDPCVADIADRAGVSHRSVFRYFDDINDLVRTAIEHEAVVARPLALIDDMGVGPLDRRIDTWVESRLRLYEATDAVNRVARHRAPTIPSINDRLRIIYQVGAKRFCDHFAPELDVLGVDGNTIVQACMTLTSFESYDLHRRIYENDVEHIRRVWAFGLSAFFGRSASIT